MFILHSFYKLSPPSKKEVALRDKKIKECKERMGDKWLLAKPIGRKDAKNG